MENTERSNNLPADGTLNKVSSSAHAAVDSIAGVAGEAVRKAKPAIERGAAKAHTLVDRAAGAAAPTAGWLSEQGENLMATQKKLVADTSSYVSANPLKSVGIALVAGFLLTRIIL